ncbi:LWR-salt protein [Natronomonas halophila]|uniref:LWR-salt protein n=1 Tax=Natronomonas halophila TaxID=2747817 RepID=UPI0015B3E317|nr:LWR-salt protein [Natronomonas halophila]QLD84254.1 LWR-salt protein [Natronomonas halophila]
MSDDAEAGADAEAAYLFTVQLYLDAEAPDVWLDPAITETTMHKAAAEPGEEGWMFFRDNLWRGEINNYEHTRRLAEEALGMEVRSIEFRELRASEAYYEDLQAEIGEHLDAFKADDAAEVVKKYLGSRVHVRE